MSHKWTDDEVKQWLEKTPGAIKRYEDGTLVDVLAEHKSMEGDDPQKAEGEDGLLYLNDLDTSSDVAIVPNFAIGGQITILHGKPGSGKSTLARQAIRSVITGDGFLGKQVIRGAVLLYAIDEGLRHAKRTLVDKMGLPVWSEHRLSPELAADADVAEMIPKLPQIDSAPPLYAKDQGPPPGQGAEWLRRNLEMHPEICLVVIDTLQAFSGIQDVNDNSEVGRTMQSLRNVMKFHPETALLVIHHAGKSGSFLGATTLVGGADIVYQMEKVETAENTNRLVNEKWRTIEKQPDLILSWDQQTHLYRVTDDQGNRGAHQEQKRTDRKETKKAQILDALKDAPNGLSKTALFAKIGGNRQANETALAEMVSAGSVVSADTAGATMYRRAAQ